MPELIRMAVIQKGGRYIWNKLRQADVFALGPSFLFLSAVYFLLTPILRTLRIFDGILIADKVPLQSFWYALLGILAFALGYYWGSSKNKIEPTAGTGFLKTGWNTFYAEIVFWATLFLGLIAKVVRFLTSGYFHLDINTEFVTGPFHSTVGFLEIFGYIAMIVAFVVYYGLRRDGFPFRRWQIYAYMAFVFEIVHGIPTCTRMKIIIPILLFLVVRWYLGRRNIKMLVLPLIIVFLVFPYGNACRSSDQIISMGASPDTAVFEAVVSPTFAMHSLISRVDQSHLLYRIIEVDDPPEYGRSFLGFLVSLGPPKFIWHSKPSINSGGNEFGRHLGLIQGENDNTYIGRTFIGDLYINFRLPGVIVGMFILGFLFRYIYQYLIVKTGTSYSGVFIYSLVWVHLMRGAESSLAPVFAGLVKMLVVLLAIHLFISGRFSSWTNSAHGILLERKRKI